MLWAEGLVAGITVSSAEDMVAAGAEGWAACRVNGGRGTGWVGRCIDGWAGDWTAGSVAGWSEGLGGG